MKYILTILTFCSLNAAMVNCKQNHNIGSETIAMPSEYRDIGYDSIQLLDDGDGKIWAAFCYPNGIRYKKDTVYTGDTAYQIWGGGVRVTGNWMLMAPKSKNGYSFKNGTFHSGGQVTICDSVTIDDSLRLTLIKIKP